MFIWIQIIKSALKIARDVDPTSDDGIPDPYIIIEAYVINTKSNIQIIV